MAGPANHIDIDRLQAAAGEACNLLKILANRDRLLLLCQLSQNEICVGELETLTGIRQPTLSQQLTVLRSKRLVCTRREGKRIFYSISSKEAQAVMTVLYGQFCGHKTEDKNDN
jgi:DNA-binding transcriptional ArsR family regulator